MSELRGFAHAGELLDALDDIPYPPFEMAVRDASGRTALVFADEDANLGILRVPYEDEPCEHVAVTADDFPMVHLVPMDRPDEDAVPLVAGAEAVARDVWPYLWDAAVFESKLAQLSIFTPEQAAESADKKRREKIMLVQRVLDSARAVSHG